MIGGLPDAPETFVLGSDQMSVRISWLEPPGLTVNGLTKTRGIFGGFGSLGFGILGPFFWVVLGGGGVRFFCQDSSQKKNIHEEVGCFSYLFLG